MIAGRDNTGNGAGGRRHILTVSVQEYFHVGIFPGVQPKHWSRFESRMGKSLGEVLEFFERHDATATFFVLGWIAERQPDLVARIVDAGHEVASSGYSPRGPRGMSPDQFREDLARARAILEDAGARPVVGYRCPSHWFGERDLWALDVLAEEGYVYDSSINPVLRQFSDQPWRIVAHEHRTGPDGPTIHELPISTMNLAGLRIGISGGNWSRQLPHRLLGRAVARWHRDRDAPLVFYFRTWEIDSEQPRIRSVSRINRIRHYRNLEKTRWILGHFLKEYRFESIRAHLELPEQVPGPSSRASTADHQQDAVEVSSATPITLVVPLYNEEQNVDYLHRTLVECRNRLSGRYRVLVNLVDDGSSDGTWSALEATFGDVPWCRLIRLPENRGVAAAILEGIRNAVTEIVCSIDCDCSYDPHVLEHMIPLLDGADLVTASPYHPEGCVFNVPGWRLLLSKTLSRMYSALLGDTIHTYTSCCRVYRRSAVQDLRLSHGGFLGVAETLISMKLAGARIVECPATLESRIFGESKMKILKTIRSHLGLLGELASGKRRAVTKTSRSGQAAATADAVKGEAGSAKS